MAQVQEFHYTSCHLSAQKTQWSEVLQTYTTVTNLYTQICCLPGNTEAILSSKISSLIAENFTVLTCVTFLEKVHHDIAQYHVTPLLYRSNWCSVTSTVSEYPFLEMGGKCIMSGLVYREEVIAHHFHNDALPGHQIPDRNIFFSITCYLWWKQIFVFMWAELPGSIKCGEFLD